jgi:hypothetical protein
MSNRQPIPVFCLKGLFPDRLSTAETWVSVALCYSGAAMPLFSDRASEYSLMLTAAMIGTVVVGFAAGLNVLASKGVALAKGVVILGFLFCAGKLLMIAVAGAQS